MVNKKYSDAFRTVKQQIETFEEMQKVLAENVDKLSPEEKAELEGYIYNQKRQCELFLKLEPEPEPEPKQELKQDSKPKQEPKQKKVKEEVKEESFEDLLG